MSTTHAAFVHPAITAVTALSVALDGLLGAPLWSMSAGQLATLVIALEKQARSVCAAQVAVLGQAESSLVDQQQGATSMGAWLKAVVDVPAGLTKAGLGLQRSLVSMEVASDAFGAGDIGFDGASAVCTAVEGLPGEVPAALTGRIEHILVDIAREEGTRAVVQHAALIVHQFAPDHLEQLEERQHAENRVAVISRHDGTVVIRGQMDKETGALALAVLGPLARISGLLRPGTPRLSCRCCGWPVRLPQTSGVTALP